MEVLFLLTLFGSVIGFWLGILLFIIVCFISDVHKEGGFGFVGLIVLGVLIFMWGNITPILPLLSWNYLFAYLGIGILYSLIRTYFEGVKLGKNIKNLPPEQVKDDSYYNNQKYYIKELKSELEENVLRWWLMWPISLTTWFIADIIREIWSLGYKTVKKFYESILDLGVKTIIK